MALPGITPSISPTSLASAGWLRPEKILSSWHPLFRWRRVGGWVDRGAATSYLT